MARSRALTEASWLDCPERPTYAPSSIRLSGSGTPGTLPRAGVAVPVPLSVPLPVALGVALPATLGVLAVPALVPLPPGCPVAEQAVAERSAMSSASSQVTRLTTSP
jgi:hypothetical protein